MLPLYQGFVDHDIKLVCYTDHQIFERYHKFNLKNGYAKKQAITLKELTNLVVGDYVTHIDHGIGKFGGLKKIQVEGKTNFTVKDEFEIVLEPGDCVFVPLGVYHQAKSIEKRLSVSFPMNPEHKTKQDRFWIDF